MATKYNEIEEVEEIIIIAAVYLNFKCQYSKSKTDTFTLTCLAYTITYWIVCAPIHVKRETQIYLNNSTKKCLPRWKAVFFFLRLTAKNYRIFPACYQGKFYGDLWLQKKKKQHFVFFASIQTDYRTMKWVGLLCFSLQSKVNSIN